MGLGQTFSRNAALPFQWLAERVVVVDPGNRKVHVLNGTASRVWALLENALTFGRLVERIADEYDLPAQGAEEEIAGFVLELEQLGLVTRHHARAGAAGGGEER